jgi:membrane protease YdiL (CAAX protease family)
MSFLAAAGWTLVAVMVFAVGMLVAEGLRTGAMNDIVTRAISAALAYSLTLFIILRVHEPDSSIRKVLALRMPPILTIPLALIVGAGLSAPLAWLEAILLARFPYSEQDKEVMEKVSTVASYDSTPKRVAVAVIIVLVVPFLDELFFRGALFTPLRKRARLEPVIMATAAYEALTPAPHLHLVIPTLLLSLALSWIRGVSGSSIASALARMAFFAPQIVPHVIGKEMPALSKGMLAGSFGAAVLALAIIVLLSRGRALDDATTPEG